VECIAGVSAMSGGTRARDLSRLLRSRLRSYRDACLWGDLGLLAPAVRRMAETGNGTTECLRHGCLPMLVQLLLPGAGGGHVFTRDDEFDGLVMPLLANQWRGLGVREWRERSTIPLAGRLPAGRFLKGLLALRMIIRDTALRGLLPSGVLYRCRGVTIKLSGLVADLFRLGILRGGGLRVTRPGFGVELQLQYDRQKERLAVETIGSGDVPAQSQPGVYSLPSKHGPRRDIVWDHSAIGTVVRVVIAGKRAWVFMGPDGQYKFRALTGLAERDLDSVSEFCPRAVRGR
jgi:hypothetical protein